jgi:glycosyltransferase involved in cell wall biosynthesis
MPVYNQRRFVAEALDSVLAQTRPPREVVVIDDGSTDGTSEILQGYGGRIRCVRQPNRGVAAARNRGAELVTSELLAFIDADDVWLPAKLERQLERCAAEPGLGLVHCGTEEIDESGRSLGERRDGLEGRGLGARMLLFQPAILGGGSGVVIPRLVFAELGGFDPRLSTSADWDLYYRIAVRHPIGFVPDVLLRYRRHAANMHARVGVMAQDMLLAYRKAFADAPPEIRRLKRRAYGRLHAVLAGSFFVQGDYWGFLRHAAASVVIAPENVGHFVDARRRRSR